MNQATEDVAHMAAAEVYAQYLSRCRRLQVCALFVRGRLVVARGINGMPPGSGNVCEDAEGFSLPQVQHAEENAIVHAARYGVALEGTTLYVTHSPCLERCAPKLVQVGVVRVVFRHVYRKTDGLDYLREAGVRVDRV